MPKPPDELARGGEQEHRNAVAPFVPSAKLRWFVEPDTDHAAILQLNARVDRCQSVSNPGRQISNVGPQLDREFAHYGLLEQTIALAVVLDLQEQSQIGRR